VTGVTNTKRKAILRDMSGHQGAVPYERIIQLASKHQLTHLVVRGILVAAGMTCLMMPEAGPAPASTLSKPRPVRPTLPITREEHAIIRSCRLYRTLSDDSDIVIVRRDLFERERALIIKLLDSFSMPKEGNT
jgi:hypothetical protein